MSENQMGINERDAHLRAVIKSNLVCGDMGKIDELVDELLKDICDVLENFSSPAPHEEE